MILRAQKRRGGPMGAVQNLICSVDAYLSPYTLVLAMSDDSGRRVS